MKVFWAKEFKELIGFNHSWLVIISILVTGFTFPYIFLNGVNEHIPIEHRPFYAGWIYAGVLHLANLFIFYKFKIRDLEHGVLANFKLFFKRNFPVHLLVTGILSVGLTLFFFCSPGVKDTPGITIRCLVGTSILMSIIVGFYETSFYMTALNKSVKEAEELKRENIQSQLDVLKAQVQPHFLFNSLNALVSIIPDEPEKAVKYVQNLSKVYRYILEIKDEKVTEVSSELACVSAYVFMLQTRFGKNLNCSISSESFKNHEFLVPLSVQILIENAVKHNVVSERKPLSIEVKKEGECLVVENNLNPLIEKEKSTETGLKNIEQRYELIGIKGFKIEKTAGSFKVYLPLIEITE